MVRSWFLDDREFLRTQHNVGDVIVIKAPKEDKRNIILGEIVKIDLDPQNQNPVKLHLFATKDKKAPNSSHTKAWFPAYKVKGKIVVNQTTRAMRSTEGTRLYQDVSWGVILPVPRVKLDKKNKIPVDLHGAIRDAVKMPVKGIIGGSKGTPYVASILKERGELNISEPLVGKEKTKINGLMRIASIALADDLGKPCYDVHAYTERFLSDEVRKTGWSRRTTGKMMM